MKRYLRQLKSKRGQTLVEYALILAFISVVAVAVLIDLGKDLTNFYIHIDSTLASGQAYH